MIMISSIIDSIYLFLINEDKSCYESKDLSCYHSRRKQTNKQVFPLDLDYLLSIMNENVFERKSEGGISEKR